MITETDYEDVEDSLSVVHLEYTSVRIVVLLQYHMLILSKKLEAHNTIFTFLQCTIVLYIT